MGSEEETVAITSKELNSLREKEIIYNTLFENVSDGIVIVKDGIVKFINKKMLDITGRKKDDVLGRSFFDFISEDDLPSIMEKYENRRSGKKGTVHFVLDAESKNGKPLDLDINAIAIQFEDGPADMVIIRDLSEERNKLTVLLENELKLRELIQQMPYPVFVTKPDGIVAMLNDAITRVFNIQDEVTAVGKMNIIEHAKHMGLAEVDQIEKAHSGETVFFPNIKIRTARSEEAKGKDTACKHYEVSMFPLEDNEGSLWLIVSIWKDITEDHFVHQALADSEEKYRNLVERANDGIIIIKDGIVKYANPRMVEMGGFTLDELLNQPFDRFVHPDERDAVVDRYMKRMSGEEVESTYTTRLINEKGAEIIAEINAGMIHYPDDFADLILVRDITERTSAEKALRESEEKFRSLAESSSAGIFIHQGGNFLFFNRATMELSEYSEKELKNMNFIDVVHEDSRELVKERAMARLRGEDPIDRYEIKIVTRSGKTKWLDLTGTPIEYEGEPAVIGTAFDITESKIVEEELEIHKEHLEELVEQRTSQLIEKNRELETFAYSVSHDLRAPLRAMQGFSQALTEDYADKLDENGVEYCDRINESAKRMDRLIQDLLVYSRLSQREIEYEALELDVMLKEAKKNLESQIETSGARISIDQATHEVIGHPTTLILVLENLLGNAIKFVEDGQTPEITARSEVRGKNVRLWIEDNGIGIDNKYMDKIFLVFERLHGKGKYHGTGIGLAIVKKGMERMEGGVGVRSEKGKGSSFWIELPNAGD